MKIFIGTSGWQYVHWKKIFYPENLPIKDWLKFYIKYFNTVEINTTFYHLTQKKTFEKWKKEIKNTKKNFLISIKLYRFFTHFKKLNLKKESLKVLKNVLENFSALGEFSGPILIQLPPNLKCNLKNLNKFIFQLRKIAEKLNLKLMLAIEFRNKSWFNEKVYQFLKKEKIAFVISDSARWPTKIIKTADWVYVRFHGKPQIFSSNYSKQELKEWSKKIKKLKPRKLFVYFNNDIYGFAVKNAKYFKKLF